MELRFVDENEFQRQGDWFILPQIPELENHNTTPDNFVRLQPLQSRTAQEMDCDNWRFAVLILHVICLYFSSSETHMCSLDHNTYTHTAHVHPLINLSASHHIDCRSKNNFNCEIHISRPLFLLSLSISFPLSVDQRLELKTPATHFMELFIYPSLLQMKKTLNTMMQPTFRPLCPAPDTWQPET